MSDRETQTPAIPSVREGNTDEVLRTLTEIVEVREGRRGDPLDQVITMRELIALGYATPNLGNASGIGSLPIFPTLPGVVPGGYNPQTDYTPPPAPSGFVVSGSFANIFLTWNIPTYRNHAYTEVWRSPADSIGTAVRVGTSEGVFYADPVGLEQTYYYWVRFVSKANVEGPYNGVAGTIGASAISPELSVQLLSEMVAKSPTARALRARIENLEDGVYMPSYINDVITRVTGLARKSDTIVSRLDGNTAAVQAAMEVANGLRASYTLKVAAGNIIAGFGTAAYPNGYGSYSSEFVVAANTFAIAPPAIVQSTAPVTNLYAGMVWVDTSVNPNVTKYYTGSTWSTDEANARNPFTVLTTPTTFNGVSRPPGVYMTDAYMGNGTIVNAMIGDLQVDNGKIVSLSVDKLLAGTIAVGQYIQSQGYVAGTSGWKIHADGTAEFSGVVVRGTIYATAGYLQGVEVRRTDGTVIMSAGGTLNAPMGIGNLVFNSEPTDGTIKGWSYSDQIGGSVFVASTSTWRPLMTGALELRNPGTVTGTCDCFTTPGIRVVPGQRYEMSMRYSAHRCSARAWINFYNSAGGLLSTNLSSYGTGGTGEYRPINEFPVLGLFATAPADAVYALVGMQLTAAAQTNPTLFGSHFYFGVAQANQTEFSPWTKGGTEVITAGNASTYIADLAVDTLQIANQAVSIPVSAFIAGQGNVGANDTALYDLVGVGVTSTGAPGTLTFSWTCSQNAPSHLSVRAYVDSTVIFFEYVQSPGLQSVTIGVQLAAGYHYLKMNIKSGDAGNYADYWVRNRAVVYVETKK
jgi:hypothetical protein